MIDRKKISGTVSALALAFVLSACSPVGVEESATGGRPAEVNEVDTHFIAMMTPHHVQAVEMSDIVLADPDVSAETRDVAQRIKDGQQLEIDQMLDWADQWQMEDDMAMHSQHIANGMLGPDDMAQLTQLNGAESEKLFLDLMIFHHEGAIAMTQDQVDGGGFAPLSELAQEMITVQTAEVVEMNEILTNL